MEEHKSNIRIKLEKLEDDIQKSWLKDLDKTKEMLEIIEILTIIEDSESLESFFTNPSDLEYFLKKFSKEVVQNILRQKFIFGENGDDIALELLKQYLKIFLKFLEKPEYSGILEHIREIFDSNKSYFKLPQIYNSNIRVLNPKKLISADKYNETLPRKSLQTQSGFSTGDIIDVLIENKKCHNLGDRRVWVRGVISEQNEEFYYIKLPEDHTRVSKSSFEIAPKGKMTKDYEWRTNLKKWEVVDCYDRGRWYPSTILSVNTEMIGNIPKVTYKIGFRLYPDKFDNWKSYGKYWNDRGFSTDIGGRKYIGDSESMDENIIFYSKRIQKFNSFINDNSTFNTKALSEDYDSFMIDEFIPFDHENNKNYIIGRGSQFSNYYAILLNAFIEMNGFKRFFNLNITKFYPELVHTIFYILGNTFQYIHKDYINLISEEILKIAFKFIKELNPQELRNIKKDTLDLITKVLRTYLNVNKSTEECNMIIKDFSITSSLRMLKTSFLDKRIQAIKVLVDVIKENKQIPTQKDDILKLIEENQIFNEIYGPNTHIQLINKSKELLEIMLDEDKLSDGEIELIWGATKKGDLEGKLTILKTLKEISKSLKDKHIQILLKNAYTTNEDLINEEIELIFELSINSLENMKKCVNHFINYLFNSKNIYINLSLANILISKVYEASNVFSVFKTDIILMCLDHLEKNENVCLVLKILTKFLSDFINEPITKIISNDNHHSNPNPNDYDLTNIDTNKTQRDNEVDKREISNLLFSGNNLLVNFFTENFKKYKQLAQEILKTHKSQSKKLTEVNSNFSINSSDFITLDNFSHLKHIEVRLEFIHLLMKIKLFDSDCNSYKNNKNLEFDYINFTYEILFVDCLFQQDQSEFFNFIKKLLENEDKHIEEKVYSIFEAKICKDTKSCQALSLPAFESYLTIFININTREGNLRYISQKDKFQIKIYEIPEKLIGFDILWKIVFDSFSSEIMLKGIEFLHLMYANYCRNEDSNENKTDNNISTSSTIQYTDILLKKCLEIIKSSESYTTHEKRNVIIKSLYFLKLIIEESEKKGTARIKSHSGLLKRKVITLKVDSHIAKTEDFIIKVYSNTTMWDLKELISQKSGIGIDFIYLTIKSKEVLSSEHGMTILERGLYDGAKIRLLMNSISGYIPQVNLIRNGRVVPELLAIFNKWFDVYSTDNKQTRRDLAKFISAVTGTRDTIEVNDQRINNLFILNDRDGKGWIDRESFVSFYVECTLQPMKRNTVWENLHTMGIRNDLKAIDEPLDNFNSDKTLLPRYQLAHNQEFYSTLVNLQDLDESIAQEAFVFLSLITTNPNIYREMLYWDGRFDNYGGDIDSGRDRNRDMNMDSQSNNTGTSDCSSLNINSISNKISELGIGISNKSKYFPEKENIFKLIYSLQIIESFIEDIEIESEGVDFFTNEEAILDLKNITSEDVKRRKIYWMESFVRNGGFDELIQILLEKLDENIKNSNLVIIPMSMSNICLELLVKIIRFFYFSSLNACDFYNTNTEIHEKSSYSNSKIIFEGDLAKKILNSFDYSKLVEKLITLLKRSCREDVFNDSVNQVNVNYGIIENSFEFLLGILVFLEDYKNIEQKLLNDDFKHIYSFGITNPSTSIRDKFSSTLSKFCNILSQLKRFDIIWYIFKYSFEIFQNLQKNIGNNEKNIKSNEFYDFFALLFEIYFKYKTISVEDIVVKNTNTVNGNQLIEVDTSKCLQFITNIAETLSKDLSDIGTLTNEQFMGHLKILTRVLENENLPDFKQEINTKYNLIQLIMSRILFKQNSREQKEMLSKQDFINPEKIEDSTKNSRNSNIPLRNSCFNFILAMLRGSLDNYEYFLSTNLLNKNDVVDEVEEEFGLAANNTGNLNIYGENININNQKISEYNLSLRNYNQSMFSRKEEHVGLRNLGCICYMNSMMQQFYMVPSFRYAILQCKDNKPAEKDNQLNIDDNVLHQVQKMFTYLDLSQREDYNPQGFCYSFKDFDGNPTNTSIQQDSQEFLNRFFDKIESAIKPTPFKYMMQSIFGGKTCSQLICEQGCGNVRNRFEDFYNLSLEVSNMKSLTDSFEKFISPERIDEYDCEICQKKVTITKRNSLSQLPNILILHLQRIYYNYEHDRNEKINSRLEFPRVLSLKNYTIEEQTRRAGSLARNQIIPDENIETDEIYFKQNEYYEYHLVGVNVHIGSADAGHYFSYINTIRSGKPDTPNEILYDPQIEEHCNTWLKFNDSYISKFNITKLEEECFGGSTSSNDEWHRMMDNNQSAYMLVYERRIKSPVKLITEVDLNLETNDQSNLISFKEEETAKIKKQFDTFRICGLNSSNGNNNGNQITNLCFYDNSNNEYFKYIPFYSLERLIPSEYYLEVSEDNSQFQKHQNILDDKFTLFFENVLSVLCDTISNFKDNISQSESVNKRVCNTLLHFIFNLLNSKDKQKLLKPAIDNFSVILSTNDACLEISMDYLLSNLNLLHTALHNEESLVVTENSKLLFNIIKRGYLISPTKFLRSYTDIKDDLYVPLSIYDKTVKLCDYLIDLFPIVSYRNLNRIAPVYKILKDLPNLGEEMVDYLLKKEVISRFITYLIGKESPCYEIFTSNNNENWDIGRSSMNNSEDLIDLIYSLYELKKDEIKSENDMKCLKARNFLKYCYQSNSKFFLNLTIKFSCNDKEFTSQSCEEVTKYIDDINYQCDEEFIKLVDLILKILEIKDELQLFRIESIVGFPMVIIEEPNLRSKWPIFGFNKLPDDSTKWLEYKSTFNMRGSTPLLKKLSQQRMKDRITVEAFLMILRSCTTNHALLKYLRNMPSEEPRYDDFINWGVNTIHNFNNQNNGLEYLESLKDIVEVLNPVLSNVLADKTILRNFKSFANKFLPNEIKREEISLLMQGQNLFILKFEYFTNLIPIVKDINYKKSASYYTSAYDSVLDSKVDPDQNIETDNNNLVFSHKERLSNEREFIKRIISPLMNNKKVVIQNINLVENVKSTMIRFVAFNASNMDATVFLKFKRPLNNDIEVNEFIPSGIVCSVNSFFYKNILTLQKINNNQDWTNSLNDLEYDVKVHWHSNNYSNNYHNVSSNYYANTGSSMNYKRSGGIKSKLIF